MEDAPKLLKTSQVGVVQTSGHVSHDTCGPNHGHCRTCKQYTSPRTTFSHAQLLRSLVAVLLSECTLTHWPHAPAWHESRSTLSALRSKNAHTSSRNIVHLAALDDTTHGHSFPHLCLHQSSSEQNNAEWRFGWATTIYRLWVQAACWRPGIQALHRRTVSSLNTRIYVSKPCPSTSRSKCQNMTQRKASRHRSRNRTKRGRTTSCSAGFTTVLTRVSSKCRTIASLSLWTRKLDVQFISRSDEHRETCCSVFKPK